MKNEPGGLKKYIKPNIVTAVSCLGMFLILAFCFDVYFDTNDDSAIRDILSGAYTGVPNGRCIQLLYPLGMVLSFLYRILPMVPWFGVFLVACQYLSLYMISHSIKKVYGEHSLRWDLIFGLMPVLVILLFFREMIFIQYTFTAGMLMAAAISGMYAGVSLPFVIIPAVLAFCLRSEIMLFLCPFILLPLINSLTIKTNEKTNEKTNDKRRDFLKVIIALAVFMILFFGWDKASYSSSSWKEFIKLFNARTDLYDYYGIPDYEANAKLYDGLNITSGEYELLVNYNIDMSDNINANTLKALSDYAKANRPLTAARTLYEACYAYVYRFVHGEELLFDILILFCYMILIKKSGKDKLLSLKTLSVFAIRTGLWIFLLYRGRVPERITHPLYMTELSLLILIIMEYLGKQEKVRKESKMAAVLFIILIICTGMVNISNTKTEYAERNIINRNWNDLRRYFSGHNKELYYMDVYSTVAYSEKIFKDGVYKRDGIFHNYETAGGWIVKSPLVSERLEHFNEVVSPKEVKTRENQYKDFNFVYDPKVNRPTSLKDENLPELYFIRGAHDNDPVGFIKLAGNENTGHFNIFKITYL